MNSYERIGLLLTSILACVFCLVIGLWAISNYHDYEKERPFHGSEGRFERDQGKFEFLMEAGELKMADGRYNEALTEFELALDIIPNDSMANARILECSKLLFSEN